MCCVCEGTLAAWVPLFYLIILNRWDRQFTKACGSEDCLHSQQRRRHFSLLTGPQKSLSFIRHFFVQCCSVSKKSVELNGITSNILLWKKWLHFDGSLSHLGRKLLREKKKNHFSEGSYFFLKKKLAINLECLYYRLFFRADRLVAMGCS